MNYLWVDSSINHFKKYHLSCSIYSRQVSPLIKLNFVITKMLVVKQHSGLMFLKTKHIHEGSRENPNIKCKPLRILFYCLCTCSLSLVPPVVRVLTTRWQEWTLHHCKVRTETDKEGWQGRTVWPERGEPVCQDYFLWPALCLLHEHCHSTCCQTGRTSWRALIHRLVLVFELR